MVGFSTRQSFSYNRKCWWHVLTRVNAGTLYWELKLWLVDNPPPLNDAYFNWSSRLGKIEGKRKFKVIIDNVCEEKW